MKTFDLHMMPPIAYEIKHGGKNDRNLPMKYDGMVVVERNREGKGNSSRFVSAQDIMSKLHEFNGITNAGDLHPVKRIPIRFLSDSIGENFNMYRAFFLRNTIACGSNAADEKGENNELIAMRRFRKENGQTEFVEPYQYRCSSECPIWNSDNSKVSCDIYGSLYFVFPSNIHPHGSFCVHRINGRNAQRRILSSLHMISKYTGGVLANLPLCIAFHFENVPDASGQLQKVPVMVIEPENGYDGLRQDLAKEKNIRASLGIDNYNGVLSDVVKRSLVTEIEETSDWKGKIKETEDDEDEKNEISVPDSVAAKTEENEASELVFILSSKELQKFESLKPAMKRIFMSKIKDESGNIDEDKAKDLLKKV